MLSAPPQVSITISDPRFERKEIVRNLCNPKTYLDKCLNGQMSTQTNVYPDKCLPRQMSTRTNVYPDKCLPRQTDPKCLPKQLGLKQLQIIIDGEPMCVQMTFVRGPFAQGDICPGRTSVPVDFFPGKRIIGVIYYAILG